MRFVTLSVLYYGDRLSGNLLCPKMVMIEPLLPILVFMVYGHHSLRCCLTSVSQTLTPSPILAMHLSPFCFGLRLRKSKSILLLLMLIVLTLPPFAFQLMGWLVLKLLALLRDLLLDCHRNGRGTTLSSVLGSYQIGVCDIACHWTCVRGTHSKCRCLGLEDGAGISDLT